MSLQKNIFKNKSKFVSMKYTKPSSSDSLDDYNPSSWDLYFDEMNYVQISDSKFRYFKAGGDPYLSNSLFVLIHGGGHSALSWSLVTKQLKDECSIFSFDLRGHGGSESEDESDLSKENLTNDIIEMIKYAYSTEDGENNLNVVIIGHSLGGSLAVNVVQNLLDNPQKNIIVKGLVVIDVVEGTALESLDNMKNIISDWPPSFPSIQHAIKWVVESRIVRNVESAKVSIPPQFKSNKNNNNDDNNNNNDNNNEDNEEKEGEVFWRTDLLGSTIYWENWFSGLSSQFLSCFVPKLLILAGTDRLDTELTIAQMQGKYQLKLLPSCGHVIQEDDPKSISDCLIQFKTRNSI
eukprot:TRINITY_DN261_c0_g6_i1.p1 TRINITY_DN261_c0_g6~~TRINITY_DN261_c0_g6_i1.p1  ORF type:complete len:349 (+),score=101.60 TRINITY_DN261_c0_g6_i1:164-1210(+)